MVCLHGPISKHFIINELLLERKKERKDTGSYKSRNETFCTLILQMGKNK